MGKALASKLKGHTFQIYVNQFGDGDAGEKVVAQFAAGLQTNGCRAEVVF